MYAYIFARVVIPFSVSSIFSIIDMMIHKYYLCIFFITSPLKPFLFEEGPSVHIHGFQFAVHVVDPIP